MPLVREVPVRPRSIDGFLDVLGEPNVLAARDLARRLRDRLGRRVIWNVNSTAAGGGVAEMLHTLLSYASALGLDVRWAVIGGEPDFFRVTKRLHNALHGAVGDGLALGSEAAEIYDRMTARNASELLRIVRPGDVAILHDPQTAGLIPRLIDHGVPVVWRCHIGDDTPSTESGSAWSFLEPYLTHAQAFVFSRFTYLPEALYHGRCLIVPPTIDPFSPKNQELDEDTTRAILVHLGLVGGNARGGGPSFRRNDGSLATVERLPELLREGPPPAWDAPLVVQVSRWDRLKDPRGVLEGFLRSIASDGADGATLVLAGPSVQAVADDPEGAEVFEEVAAHWRGLAADLRRRVLLVNLPMDDLEENAAMVNALQRHAAIVVQKSLREGFGLTVTEAMWKARPVVASAVGGIQDQIQHGVSGLLLKHPDDLDAFAGAITQLLSNRALGERLGRNARRRVRQNYLGLNLVAHYDDLVERLDHDPRVERARPAAEA